MKPVRVTTKTYPLALSLDSKLFVEIMGSYRRYGSKAFYWVFKVIWGNRGKADCGDIDILITRPTDDDQTHSGMKIR